MTRIVQIYSQQRALFPIFKLLTDVSTFRQLINLASFCACYFSSSHATEFWQIILFQTPNRQHYSQKHDNAFKHAWNAHQVGYVYRSRSLCVLQAADGAKKQMFTAHARNMFGSLHNTFPVLAHSIASREWSPLTRYTYVARNQTTAP